MESGVKISIEEVNVKGAQMTVDCSRFVILRVRCLWLQLIIYAAFV